MTPARHSRMQIERCETHLCDTVRSALSRHHSLERSHERSAMLVNVATYDDSSSAKIKRPNSHTRFGEALPRGAEAQAQSDHERRRKLVHLLTPPAHQHFELAKAAMRLKIAHAMAALGKPVPYQLHQAPLVLGDVPLEFLTRAHAKLRGGRRCGRAQVRDKIGNREIGFVAHTRYHGNFGSENRARNHLLVESPQILERTAATSNDEHVGKS